MKKNRITILTGAGFTFPFGTPSTQNLTDKLKGIEFENYKIKQEGEDLTPGEYLSKILCEHYKIINENPYFFSIVNFETIIHLLEEFYSLFTSLYKTSDITNDLELNDLELKDLALSKGVKPAFLELKANIDNVFRSLEAKTQLPRYKIVRDIYTQFINTIIKELENFNLDSKNKGMRKFESDLLVKYLPKSQYVRRFYTLNYDTWLNKHLAFYDGFDEAGNFESEKVMQEYKIDCHYNLHGSILWKNLPQYQVKKLKKQTAYSNHLTSLPGLNRERVIPTPIITGYRKLERMKFNPYLQFYYALHTDILKSDLLLIIGYSFSDPHINNILSMFKGKCVVVGYINSLINANKSAKYNKNDVDLVLKSVLPSDGGFSIKGLEEQKGWISSKGGKTRYWWKGIGESFYENWRVLSS